MTEDQKLFVKFIIVMCVAVIAESIYLLIILK